MPRPNQTAERRRAFLPILVQTFAELGYRRTTTAELGARCEVRENILYRLWPDKRAMFVAALDYVYELSEQTWSKLLEQADSNTSAAQVILDYESKHHGEFGLYRIVFAGLSETDDAEIAAALKRLYGRFQRFTRKQVEDHQGGSPDAPDPALVAWAIVGLGTVANIGRELGLMSAGTRKRLVGEVGHYLLGEA